MKDTILELKKKLTDAVQGNKACGLLFSGGLDSAILANINPNLKAITINFKSCGKDIKYATSVAKLLNMQHYQKSVDIDEALEAIPKVIKILKTFDPAIPNDLVVYFGLKRAKELGLKDIMVGDGSDELFAGYDFMQEINDLPSYIEKISKKMSFSSNEIGDFLGIEIIQPFMDKDIVDFALQIPVDLKIKKHDDKTWGKWILRKTFENALPKEVIWQSKRPLEIGSGMTGLRKIISDKISDDEFKESKHFVKFLNKEHMYYYKIYMAIFREIPKPIRKETGCPGCGAGLRVGAFHCKICGHVLDWRGQKK